MVALGYSSLSKACCALMLVSAPLVAAVSSCTNASQELQGPISPGSTPDDAGTFVNTTYYYNAAVNATTPSGYSLGAFNLSTTAVYNASAYRGYTAISTYNTSACATICDVDSGCQGFNIYFQRNPANTPGTTCVDPPSTALIMCAFWGADVPTANFNNTGETRFNFRIVIAGSNFYYQTNPNKTTSTNGTYIALD